MITNKRDVRDSLIMIKPLPVETVTKSGLYVDFVQGGERLRGDQPVKGIAVGVPKVFQEAIPVGSCVLYDDLSGGFHADFEGVEHFWTKPAMVLAVLERPEVVEIPVVGA